MYQLRPMTVQDIPDMMVINRRCFPTPWSAWAIQFDLNRNPNSFWFVLESIDNSPPATAFQWVQQWLLGNAEKKIIGFCAFWIINGESHITNIGVDPDFQGQHLGDFMVWAILQLSIRAHATFSSLEVRVSNQVAIRLYEKYGYHIRGRKERYYHDDREDAHDMATPPFDTSFRAMLTTRREDFARQNLYNCDEIEKWMLYET